MNGLMSFLNFRYNRPTYWLLLAIFVAFSLFLVFVLQKKSGYVSEIVLAIICIPRMHDIGKSGKIVGAVVAAYFVVAIGLIFVMDMDSALIALGLINFIVAGFLIWLGVIPGQEEENKYGPPPLNGVSFKKP